MNHFHSQSRINKFETRRKNTKAITLLMIIGSGLVVVLLMMFIFGGNDQKDTADQTENNEQNKDEPGQVDENNNYEDMPENNDNENQNSEEQNDMNDHNDYDEEVFITEPSDDENVISSFTKNWDPIGTEQSEPHVIQYEKGTQDRIEMEEAIRLATGLNEMIVWWLGRDGEQQVIATVTPKDQSENYRVYLSWITKQGWQPTKVEILYVNDKH